MRTYQLYDKQNNLDNPKGIFYNFICSAMEQEGS